MVRSIGGTVHKSRYSLNIRIPAKDPLDAENFYADAVTTHRRHGSIVVDGKEVASTLQCVHCNCHFTHRRNRGDWVCLKCSGVVCGKRVCVVECIPFEKRLDDYECGKRSLL